MNDRLKFRVWDIEEKHIKAVIILFFFATMATF